MFSHVGWSGLGLCNQLSSIVNAISHAINHNFDTILLDYFLIDYNRNEYKSVDNLLDIYEMNKLLDQAYKIKLIAIKKGTKFKAVYGNSEKKVEFDLTKFINANNQIIIPAGLIINDHVNCDPSVSKKKYLEIELTTSSGFSWVQSFPEYRNSDIKIDLNRYSHRIFLTGLNSVKSCPQFLEISKMIRYNKVYVEEAINIYKNWGLKDDESISAIHLRIEHDAAIHWGGIHNISIEKYFIIMKKHYYKLITENIPKTDTLIVLTADTNNSFINELIEEGYNIKYKDYNELYGREENAIIDIILATRYCNNIFIGNHKKEPIFDGSTYSYFIDVMLPANVKQINQDFNQIFNLKEQQQK
jgi:hypothetical protein